MSMNQENAKTCRYCGEQVKAIAKVCPRCRQWLSPFSFRNPGILIGLTCIWCFLLLVFFVIGLHKMINPGMDFAPYRNQISVVESHMFFGTNMQAAPFTSVVTLITNQSDKEWKGIELEARFFDKTGALIDVGRGEYYETLYPKTDGAIRINASMLRAVTNYDSYKIYVGGARDVHSRF
jgi:hypothetical protein